MAPPGSTADIFSTKSANGRRTWSRCAQTAGMNGHPEGEVRGMRDIRESPKAGATRSSSWDAERAVRVRSDELRHWNIWVGSLSPWYDRVAKGALQGMRSPRTDRCLCVVPMRAKGSASGLTVAADLRECVCRCARLVYNQGPVSVRMLYAWQRLGFGQRDRRSLGLAHTAVNLWPWACR